MKNLAAFSAFVKAWWPSALTLGVVLYATLWPDPELPEGIEYFPGFDKLIHAVMMGGLYGAFLFDIARKERREAPACFKANGGISRRQRIFLAVLVMMFCVVDELFQAEFTATRSAEALDLLADWLGIAVAFYTAPPAIRACLTPQRGRWHGQAS